MIFLFIYKDYDEINLEWATLTYIFITIIINIIY